MKESAGREREGTQQAVKSYRGPCQCSSPSLHPTKGSKRPAFLAPTDGESEPAPACSPRRQQAGGAAQTCSSRKRGATDAWAHLFVPPASFPLAPVPPAMGGSGLTASPPLDCCVFFRLSAIDDGSRSASVAGSRWAEMAAIVRGARAGRGGHGRDQGRRRGPADDQEPVPQDRDTPLNFQWTLWLMGNENMKEKVESQQQKMYRYLEKSPRISKMELDYFAVPEALLIQPAHIVTMLHAVVDYYNTMMPIRQKFLFKKLHGCWCKEMEQMLKRLTKYVELADEKIEAIREAGGNCPPRPKVFDALPDLC